MTDLSIFEHWFTLSYLSVISAPVNQCYSVGENLEYHLYTGVLGSKGSNEQEQYSSFH